MKKLATLAALSAFAALVQAQSSHYVRPHVTKNGRPLSDEPRQLAAKQLEHSGQRQPVHGPGRHGQPVYPAAAGLHGAGHREPVSCTAVWLHLNGSVCLPLAQ